MSAPPSGDLLAAVVGATRRVVEARSAARPMNALELDASRRTPRADEFRRALADGPPPRIIAECKRRSPSRGVLRHQYDPAETAAGYAQAGAAAVSVLTEPTFFDGAVEHLQQVRERVSLPVLRKDFVVDPYQVIETRGAGADAVLLIVGALPGDDLPRLMRVAADHGLAALVEVHDDAELDLALEAGATIVGVNSRNLRTLEVDLDVFRRLAARIPDTVISVAESGLRTADDLRATAALGYRAFLVGERFMAARDPGGALAALRQAWAHAAGDQEGGP